MISAHEVEHAAFGRAGSGKSGYDEATVDDFLDRVVATLEAIEKNEPLPRGAVASTDVVEATFGEKGPDTSGGYDLDDVDDLLDRVAQRLFEDEKKRGGTRDVADAGAAGTAGAAATAAAPEGDRDDEREDFRDEPAAPELQDSPRSWDEEPRQDERTDSVDPVVDGPVAVAESDEQRAPEAASGSARSTTTTEPGTLAGNAGAVSVGRDQADAVTSSEASTSAAPAADSTTRTESKTEAEAPATTSAPAADSDVEQYPATDHRVPLPRNDVSSHFSDEDVQAQQNYHPEFSEYDAEAAQEKAAAKPADTSTSDVSSSTSTDSTATPTTGSAPGENLTFGEAAASHDDVTSEATTSSEGTAQTTADSTTSATSGTPASTTTETSTGTSTKDTTGVARPEGISRPEPIDRPQSLPKRDDKSRKGLLRRIFKG